MCVRGAHGGPVATPLRARLGSLCICRPPGGCVPCDTGSRRGQGHCPKLQPSKRQSRDCSQLLPQTSASEVGGLLGCGRPLRFGLHHSPLSAGALPQGPGSQTQFCDLLTSSASFPPTSNHHTLGLGVTAPPLKSQPQTPPPHPHSASVSSADFLDLSVYHTQPCF